MNLWKKVFGAKESPKTIHEAARSGGLEKVTALLRANPDLVFSKDKYGCTPLHWAAQGGNKDVVQLLLDNGAEVNAKQEDGWTPLRFAEYEGWNDVAELLRQRGGVKAANTASKAASVGNVTANPEVSAVPTLTCAGCSKTYRIGDDAIAVTVEFGFSLERSTVIFDGSAPEREDLVSALETSPQNLPSARVKALQNWKIIQDGLSRGQRRTWRCRVCDEVNAYPSPKPTSETVPTPQELRIEPMPIIKISDAAVSKMNEILNMQEPRPGGMRIALVGDCREIRYSMSLENAPNMLDKIYNYDGLKVFIDEDSALYLAGVVIEFVETLDASGWHSGFKFDNPGKTRRHTWIPLCHKCGRALNKDHIHCGTSVAGPPAPLEDVCVICGIRRGHQADDFSGP